MKLKGIYSTVPVVSIVDDRNIKFEKQCIIDVVTDEGLLSYVIKPGFITNGRSGPSLIDGFVPHFGDKITLISWVVHDINYYEFLSKELSDELLRQMLIYSGKSSFKAYLVKKSVELFGNNSYSCNTPEDIELRKLITFEWKHV